ncbi:MAG TPA: ABC transporter substrate-binding protein [Polyangiaceae bacterium]
MHRRTLLAALGTSGFAGGACGRSRPEDGRVPVTLWYSYGGKNREVLTELVARFNRAQRHVHVEATYQGDYYEALAKLRTALAAGAGPTLSHVVVEVLPYLAEAKTLEPLDGYPGANELGLVRPLAQAGAYVKGDSRPLYGVPFNRSIPVAYLNAELFERERLEPPRTWTELVDAARRLTVRSATPRWGFGVPISWWFWVAMTAQAGGELVTPSGETTFGGAAGERALAFLQRLVHGERVMRLPPGRDYNAWQVTNQDFIAGRVAMTWMSTAFLRYIEENARFRVAVAPLPAESFRAVPTGGTFFVMLAAAPSEEKRAAWEFLRFMCRTDQAVDWATRTGYLPVTEGAVARLYENGFFAKHPNDAVAQRELSHVLAWPWAPNLFRSQRDILEPRLEDAVIQGRDAKVVLREARELARRPW